MVAGFSLKNANFLLVLIQNNSQKQANSILVLVNSINGALMFAVIAPRRILKYSSDQIEVDQ